MLNDIKSEVTKNYSPSQIYHAFRGAETHEGSQQLDSIGGSSLKRQDVVNLKHGMKPTDVRVITFGKLMIDDVLQACGC